MRIGFLQLLIEIAKNPQQALAKPVEFMVAVRQSGYFVHPTVSKDTFEELKSTGHLRLIDNDLKELIFSYYTSSDRLGQKKDVSAAVATSFFDAASDYSPSSSPIWKREKRLIFILSPSLAICSLRTSSTVFSPSLTKG